MDRWVTSHHAACKLPRIGPEEGEGCYLNSDRVRCLYEVGHRVQQGPEGSRPIARIPKSRDLCPPQQAFSSLLTIH